MTLTTGGKVQRGWRVFPALGPAESQGWDVDHTSCLVEGLISDPRVDQFFVGDLPYEEIKYNNPPPPPKHNSYFSPFFIRNLHEKNAFYEMTWPWGKLFKEFILGE